MRKLGTRWQTLSNSLVGFGADPAALHLLDEDGPNLLPYATLITARRTGDATLRVVDAVYEWQGSPLVFLVDEDSLKDEDHLRRIRRLLAMRGDAPYVAVVAPGRLDVFQVALDKKSLQQARVDVGDDERSAAFPRLGNVRPKATITNRGWISNVILSLLTGSLTSLIELGVSDVEAISLVGRALFTRFLADRNLLPEHMSDPIVAARLFDTPDEARRTSNWLDTTFNGDLLPLSVGIYDVLPEKGYGVLGDILRRAPNGQLFLGWEEKWGNLDFSQIPVGVLSQAYELYLRNNEPNRQRREGGYFTPRPIAELMVRASFRALERRGIAKSARILDPAVGGGIFLLTAFRELVVKRWQADGRRPNTNDLRRILYSQLVGFDINEAALRFAALGLYLMSIELDPNPTPVDKLGFYDILGTVLHCVKSEDEEVEKSLGSLGPLIGREHAGRYDLVIGNPPWASGTKLPKWELVRAMVNSIATRRMSSDASPPLPNEGLDLPFVWRAMEWAKPDAQIAFALHARLLFQQGDGMPAARMALFEALDVTSIINGAELRQTKVWPQISAPFCIMFATNRDPGVEAGFRFISPRIEETLNGSGSMRIDTRNADVVSTPRLKETPEILKILFRGTEADVGTIERIRTQGHPTLADFWRKKIGVGARSRLRGSGNGYQTLRKSSRVRHNGDGLPGVDASYLRDLPEITVASFSNIYVQPQLLAGFSHSRIHDPRSRDLFAGPLVVIHKSPSVFTGRIGVAISDSAAIFNETFYGYCPTGHPNARLLVRYLALVLGSKLTVWLSLLTSGEFGFERDVIEKATLDRIPLPDFDKLTEHQRREIERLVEGLHSGRVSWTEVDDWIVRLYGLGDRDLQAMVDTLEFGLPFSENKRKAQIAPDSTEKEHFRRTLRDELSPWCKRFGSKLTVDQMPPITMSPWDAIGIRTVPLEPKQPVPPPVWTRLLEAADATAASEIIFEDRDGGLLVGRLAQRRYWSETQARLLAKQIIWSYVDSLNGHADS